MVGYNGKCVIYYDSKTDIQHGYFNSLNKYIGYHYQGKRSGFWLKLNID